jgi:hypothetical protein
MPYFAVPITFRPCAPKTRLAGPVRQANIGPRVGELKASRDDSTASVRG